MSRVSQLNAGVRRTGTEGWEAEPERRQPALRQGQQRIPGLHGVGWQASGSLRGPASARPASSVTHVVAGAPGVRRSNPSGLGVRAIVAGLAQRSAGRAILALRGSTQRRIGTTQPNDRWSRLLRVQDRPCGWRRPTSNKALQLTKREYLVGWPASRASVIESRFAAERRCWAYGNGRLGSRG